MPTRGALIVIFSQDGNRTLLTKRDDFRVWTVPGGRIEVGESAEQAAQREALEETGYNIVIDQYLGEYWRPQLQSLVQAYIGHVADESSQQSYGWESVAVEWFNMDQLPTRMSGFAREVLHDARFATSLPVKRTLLVPKWQLMIRHIGLRIRSLRNHLLRR